MWFLEAKFNNFLPDSWVVSQGYEDRDNSFLYVASTYWTLMMLTTVGYGDIHPVNDMERMIALIWMVVGIGYYSYNIGNLSSIINTIDVKSAHLA
jgi:hypothetical protein